MILGLKFAKTDEDISLSLKHSIESMLQKFD